MLLFIKLGFFDILDILIVAFIFYQIYRLVKGTVAINIFAGIFPFSPPDLTNSAALWYNFSISFPRFYTKRRRAFSILSPKKESI